MAKTTGLTSTRSATARARWSRGKLKAESPAVVATELKSMGYAPVSITQANAGLKREISIPGFGNKVKLKDLAIMSRQFATMINSGLSLLRALTILEEQTECKPLAKVLVQVRNEVEGGRALSDALAVHPTVFPPLMVNMCRAGEVGGFLDRSLLQIAANYEAEVKLRGKVKSAMTYPVVVLVMAVLGVTGMLLFIVPTFEEMFASLGGTLPAPTQVPGVPVGAAQGDDARSSIVALIVLGVSVEEVQATPTGPQRRRPAEAQDAGVRHRCSRRSRVAGSPATSAR